MIGYWIRHRLLATIALSAVVAIISSLLFAFPFIIQRANNYNSQSMYKNTDIDFIVPEPSFDQVKDLPGTNGIDSVFPFYLTKTPVNVNGESRTTTVLLSDQFQCVDFTMYNNRRLINKSEQIYDNPILVDRQFCNDTSAEIGDTISMSIDGNDVEFRIYAIYETNTVYDGGAILAQISTEQKEAIQQKSSNNGYSGMYVFANDYGVCKSYLSSEYRPLGRLRSRDQFEDDDKYQIHYDAIMSSGYANEITDFRMKESGLEKKNSPVMIWVGAIFSFIVIIAFNICMTNRGCERVYFSKQCIPKGQSVKLYYIISFAFENILFLTIYSIGLVFGGLNSSTFIPKIMYDLWLVIIPIGVILAGIFSFVINCSVVSANVKLIGKNNK